MKQILVVELHPGVDHAQAQETAQRIKAAVHDEYWVLVVTSDTKIYEVGRWLWQRALRRVKA